MRGLMKDADTLKICILTVGDELLEGVILNSNAQWLGQELWTMGLAVSEHVTVADDVDAISRAVDRLSTLNDICVISGGLGPTTDDVTVDALARALGEFVVTDTAQAAKLVEVGLNDVRAQHQARRPKSAVAHDNTTGHAPLIECALNECICIALPGVPMEFQSGVRTLVKRRVNPSSTYTSVSLAFLNLGESRLMKTVNTLQLSAEIECRYLATPPFTFLRLRTQSDIGLEATVTAITQRLEHHYLPFIDDALNEQLHKTLDLQGLTIATAESCTSGLIADALAQRPGSSSFLVGGIVAYSNAVKLNQLAIDARILNEMGAVSEACAGQMAQNVARILQADIGLSVTGIAGPGGGTADKPVGTVCFGWHLGKETIVQTVLFRGNRSSIRRASAVWSLHRCLELIRARG
jgi:nicotinamide-nucleotide amidase